MSDLRFFGFLAFVFLGLVVAINIYRPYTWSHTLLVRPPSGIKHMSFGYHELLADSLWIRVIQNFDSCGKDGVATVHDYKKGVDLAKLPRCDFSWVYAMTDAATTLAPKFYFVYYAGGMNLSFLVNDISGAASLYEKGLRIFPTDLPLLFSAAYHSLENEKDSLKAAGLFSQAAEAGAPSYLMGLAAKLFSKEGRLEFAQHTLARFIEKLPEDDEHRERLEKRLKSLREELADQGGP